MPKKLIMIAILTLSEYSLACKPILQGRDFTVDQLIENTSVIALVTVDTIKKSKVFGFNDGNRFDYKMKVKSLLKGNKKIKSISLEEFEGPDVEAKEPGPGLDCINHGGFKKDGMYLIFKDSQSSKGYKRIQGENDPWLLEVKAKLLKLSKAKK